VVAALGSAGITWGPLHLVAIPTPQFNKLLNEWKVKSGVLITAVVQLLRAVRDLPGTEPILVLVDQLGGRHDYTPILHEAFPEAWAQAVDLGPNRYHYELMGLNRAIKICFQPKADGEHLNVALASMAAKYWRERFMELWNVYWQARCPGLKPTAGYPVDAKRFLEDIRTIVERDKIDLETIWRNK
jgi:ribonuclease HII